MLFECYIFDLYHVERVSKVFETIRIFVVGKIRVQSRLRPDI